MSGSDMPPWSFCEVYAFTKPKAINEMIDGEACSLHKGVDDDGSHEPESTLQQIFADGLCFRTPQRNISRVSEFVDHRFVIHATPYVAAERAEFLHYLRLQSTPWNSNHLSNLCSSLCLDQKWLLEAVCGPQQKSHILVTF